MKLLTLLTSLIITLASSNVFAKTFICENWVDFEGNEIKGSSFIGVKGNETLRIRDRNNFELNFNYLGNTSGGDYYYSKTGGITEIIVVQFKVNLGKEIQKKVTWDLHITTVNSFRHLSSKYITRCNYQ